MVQIITPTQLIPATLPFDTNSAYFDGVQQAAAIKASQDADARANQSQGWAANAQAKADAQSAAESDAVKAMFPPQDNTTSPTPSAPPSSPTLGGTAGVDPASTSSGGGLSSVSSATPAAPTATVPSNNGLVDTSSGPPIPPMQDTSGIYSQPNAQGTYSQTGVKPQTPSAMDLNPGYGPGTSVADGGSASSPGLPLPASATAPADSQSALAAPAPATPGPAAAPTPSPGVAPAAAPLAAPIGKLSQVSSGPTSFSLDQQLARNYAAKGLGGPAVAAAQRSIAGSKANTDQQTAQALAVLDAADSGDINKAMQLAQSYGEQIDPQVLANSKARNIMRTTIQFAQYAGATNDPAWQQKFAANFTQTGDAQQAMAAAGKPAAAPAKEGTYKDATININGKDQAASFNTSTGKFEPSGYNASDSSKVARQTNEQLNYTWMTTDPKEGGLGMSAAQAQQFITSVKSNPGARANSIMRLTQAIIDNAPRGKPVTLEDATAQATKSYDSLTQAAMPGAKAPVTPPASTVKAPTGPAAAPGAKGPAPPAPRIDAKNDSGEQIYSTDGGQTWYNAKDNTRYDEGE